MPKVGVRAAGYRARQSPTTREDSLKLAVGEAFAQSITQDQQRRNCRYKLLTSGLFTRSSWRVSIYLQANRVTILISRIIESLKH